MINQPHPATPFSWANDPVAFSEAPMFFLAHEVAHQWWGQAVGAKNYHEQWISEGFAQYMAWLYVESTEGPATSRRLMARMRETALEYGNEGPIHLGARIGHLRANSRAFRAILYNKSASVLHMLRRLMGDRAFFAGLSDLYRESEFTRIATDDVERAFQRQTRLPLSAFFDRWISTTVVPEVRVSSVTVGGAPRVRVEQIGGEAVFPIDLDLRYADGTGERVTVSIVDRVTEIQPSRPVRQVVVAEDLSIVRVRR
jgi:aminopeptidase N